MIQLVTIYHLTVLKKILFYELPGTFHYMNLKKNVENIKKQHNTLIHTQLYMIPFEKKRTKKKSQS